MNGDADGEAGAPLLLDHFRAGALGAREQLGGEVRREAGIFLQRQAGGRGAGPNGDHAVAMLAEDQSGNLRRRGVQSGGDQAAKANRIELRAEADDLRQRQIEPFVRQVGEDVDRIGDDEDDCIARVAHAADLIENAREQIDVAIDQVQPALVRLAAQTGGDADHVAIGNVFIAARLNHLIGDERAAVHEIEALGPPAPSALASIKAISRTMRPVCKANAVHEPTSPAPPIMLTFMSGAFRCLR